MYNVYLILNPQSADEGRIFHKYKLFAIFLQEFCNLFHL